MARFFRTQASRQNIVLILNCPYLINLVFPIPLIYFSYKAYREVVCSIESSFRQVTRLSEIDKFIHLHLRMQLHHDCIDSGTIWRFPIRYGIGTLKLNLPPFYTHSGSNSRLQVQSQCIAAAKAQALSSGGDARYRCVRNLRRQHTPNPTPLPVTVCG